jgi:hypothetical protein
MAKRRKPAAKAETTDGEHVSAQDKIARLLALLVVKDVKNNTDKVPMLRRAGFGVAEVADLLNISANQVRVADHLGRKKKSS